MWQDDRWQSPFSEWMFCTPGPSNRHSFETDSFRFKPKPKSRSVTRPCPPKKKNTARSTALSRKAFSLGWCLWKCFSWD